MVKMITQELHEFERDTSSMRMFVPFPKKFEFISSKKGAIAVAD
jgi:hypothetical protein